MAMKWAEGPVGWGEVASDEVEVSRGEDPSGHDGPDRGSVVDALHYATTDSLEPLLPGEAGIAPPLGVAPRARSERPRRGARSPLRAGVVGHVGVSGLLQGSFGRMAASL